MQCDLRQFFPSIDHTILDQILTRKLHDPQVRWLIKEILTSGSGLLTEQYEMTYFPDDDLFAVNRPRGLPIGNLTSQFWANCYLNFFDHFIKRELGCAGYVRYVDDFLLFGMEKRVLWQWKKRIEARLAQLRLTIHPGAQPKPVVEGIPFLGFITYPQRRRLKRRKGVYYAQKLGRLYTAYHQGSLSPAQVTASVQSWVNHLRYGNTYGLRRAILAEERLR